MRRRAAPKAAEPTVVHTAGVVGGIWVTDGIGWALAGSTSAAEIGDVETLEKSFRSIALGGEIAWVGTLGGGAPAVDLSAVFNAVASLRAVAVGSRAQFVAMTRAIAAHRMRPIIDRVFAFHEAPAAFAYYAAGKAFGKVVIKVA